MQIETSARNSSSESSDLLIMRYLYCRSRLKFLKNHRCDNRDVSLIDTYVKVSNEFLSQCAFFV